VPSSGANGLASFSSRGCDATSRSIPQCQIYLFVQATGRNLDHDLTLAGAEGFETLLGAQPMPCRFPTGTIASEAGVDRVEEFLITEWFVRNSMALPFIACTVIEMSACALMKMIDISLFAAARSR
jgi:hypothetical protein